MMHIILVQPPEILLHDIQWTKSENLGICYLASSLREAGHQVTILNAPVEELALEEVVSRIADSGCDVIGVSFSMQESVKDGQLLVESLRQRGIESHITVGGHFATFEAFNILAHIPAVNSVVRGEGEHTIVELVHCIENDKSLREVKGLTFRFNDEIVENEDRRNIEDLDTLPFPARDTLGPVIDAGDRVAVSAQRGCYAHCTYCSIQAFYKRPGIRRRSPKNVVDEIESLVVNYGAKRFSFIDDEFADRSTRSREWVHALCTEIKARELDIDFWVQLRACDCIEEMLVALKEVGLRELFIGVDSFSQNALDDLNKQVKEDDILQAMALVDSLGLRLEIGFIMFEPDMSLDALRENFEWLRHFRSSIPVHFYGFAWPFSGTPLRDKLLRENRLVTQSWHDVGTYKFKDPRVENIFNSLQSLKPQITKIHNLVDQGTVLYRLAMAQVVGMSSDKRSKSRHAIKVLRDADREKRKLERAVLVNVFEQFLAEVETNTKGIITEETMGESRRELAQIWDSFMSAESSIKQAFTYIEDQRADRSR